MVADRKSSCQLVEQCCYFKLSKVNWNAWILIILPKNVLNRAIKKKGPEWAADASSVLALSTSILIYFLRMRNKVYTLTVMLDPVQILEVREWMNYSTERFSRLTSWPHVWSGRQVIGMAAQVVYRNGHGALCKLSSRWWCCWKYAKKKVSLNGRKTQSNWLNVTTL